MIRAHLLIPRDLLRIREVMPQKHLMQPQQFPETHHIGLIPAMLFFHVRAQPLVNLHAQINKVRDVLPLQIKHLALELGKNKLHHRAVPEIHIFSIQRRRFKRKACHEAGKFPMQSLPEPGRIRGQPGFHRVLDLIQIRQLRILSLPI